MPQFQLSRVTRWGAVTVAVVAIATAMAAGTLASRSLYGGAASQHSCLVPKVTGKTLAAAKHAIKAHNCRVGKITRAFSTKVKSGRVISQTPKAHQRLKHGAKVNLVVSQRRKSTAHRLAVVLAGTGAGTLTGSGISCPGTCSHSYTTGSSVTLTASPASGSSFSGWSGGGCSGTGVCTVTMSADQAITATFAATHTLTVSRAGSGSGTVTGSGISCPGTCSHSYTAGSKVTLTASPASGSSFSGWSGGGCSGNGTCTVTMSSDQAVTATFAANPQPTHTLTVSLAGSGSGTVTGSGISCPGTCAHSYTAGSMVTLTASPASGSSFGGWSGGGCSGTGACTVTMSADQSVTATFGVVATGPQPGSYSGSTSQGWGVSLYVSADGVQVQDINLQTIALTCTPSAPSPNPSPDDSFHIASIPINADESFSSTTGQTRVIGNAPVHVTYTFSGQFTGTHVAGSVREDISYDGTATTCTSNTLTWTASRENQGNQAALAPPAGSYGGVTSQGWGVSLYVSPNSTQLQDITLQNLALSCTPSTPSPNPSPYDNFYIASIPINADGSFSTTTTETGVIGNAPVHITYTFSGHFHGQNTSNNERVGGMVREDLSYDGTSRSCTSGDQYWSATWQNQGNQAALAPPAGSYGGVTSQGWGVSLYVSPNSTQLQDITLQNLALSCTPSTPSPNPSPYDNFSIASIPINADGSFSTTTTETGVIGNAPVHITYTFSGHFHGQNTSNSERVAGVVRETLTYDGSSTSCTSNNQYWSATWQNQGNQAALAPPAGSYGGVTSQGWGVSLYVSPNSTQLQDITLQNLALSCTPSTPSPNPSPYDNFYIASIPINADGSFSTTTTETGVIGNAPVHITYTFSGHFHGQNTSNSERVAGVVRETLTYDGSSTSCTSNNQYWSATWQNQGNQAALAPPAGSYGGVTSQGWGVSLGVSSDSTQLQNVTVQNLALSCAPSTPSPNPSPYANFSIASIPINADGSFSTTTTETGVIGNAPVHITYAFSGHFHGRNTSNKERVAGLVRVDISYDGTSTSCTSNNQYWSATQQ